MPIKNEELNNSTDLFNASAMQSIPFTMATIKIENPTQNKVSQVNTMPTKTNYVTGIKEEKEKKERKPKTEELKNRRRGVASIVLGILGLFSLAFGFRIAATVLGNKAFKQSEKGSQNQRIGKVGRAFGITGLIMRLVAIAMLLLIFALFL